MDGNQLKDVVKEFCSFLTKKLGKFNNSYKIKLSYNRTPDFKTYAYYDPSSGYVGIYCKNRSCADILRSIAHELIHHKQNQENRLTGDIPDIGGEIEDEANALAGRLVKEFGYKSKTNIYE